MELLSIALKAILAFLILYTVLPTALVRLGHCGAISRIPKGRNQVALTFDDGPDPRYTPQILRILDQYQVKAAFFVTGEKARAHPELIRQIAAAGHTLGSHGYRHKALCLLSPGATIREITETDRILTDITHKQPIYHRPAWGIYNLASLWHYRRCGLKVVLWTYMSWDWNKNATADKIIIRVLNKLHDGVILIFHDSESTGAAPGGPLLVIQALPKILEGIRNRGLQAVPLNEIDTRKGGPSPIKKVLLSVWSFTDRIIRLATGITDSNKGESSFFRIARRRYRGQDWPLHDGTVMKKNDCYMEIHVNNEYLLHLIGENTTKEHMGITAMREIRRSLPLLAKIMQDDPRYSSAKILLGITLLHRGTVRLGFTSYELSPGIFRTLTNWYENALLTIFHQSKTASTHREKLFPKYIIMTRQELMRRYPQQ